MDMSALMSAPSDKKASRVQKCSLIWAQLSGKRVRGGAEGSRCRAKPLLRSTSLQGSRGEESPTILKLEKPDPYILS